MKLIISSLQNLCQGYDQNMKYTVKKGAGRPAYLQLYEQLRQDIVSGAIEHGRKLPSKRLLAEETGVSVITVEHCLALLVDEGYAEARERSGFYACFVPGQSTAPGTGRASLEDMSAAVGVPEDFPFSVLAKTMRRVLSSYDRRILSRAPNSGCAELRTVLAEYLARSRGIEVRPEQVIIGSGAEYLYGLVVQLFGREQTIALEDPSYVKIRQVYEANGAECTMLRLGEDGILSSELRGCGAGVLHVTPFHSYPSGVTATAAKRREYALWARAHGAYIVEDDYDSEFSALLKPVETVFSVAPERVIYINSFSKTIAPAIRTGYMVLPEPLTGLFEQRLGFYSCTVPVFEQLVLAEFIRSGELERYINRKRRELRQKMKG